MDDFLEVYQIYYHKVHRFLRSLTGNEQQAEDLTQEVFYKALLHIGQYREDGSMLAWLCTIGKNAYLNECRKQRRLCAMDAEIPDTAPGPEEVLEERERRRVFREAVLELPKEYQDVVILHIYGEIPLREIALSKGKSESWGKVTYYRAKQMLIQKLEGFK